jgi:23S rRNA (cytosine1962-C5)-methyltransferase
MSDFKEVVLLYPPKGPFIYKRMVDEIPKGILKGDVVRVLNKNGEIFGYSFYNPSSQIVFRLLTRSFEKDFNLSKYIEERIEKSIEFRKRFNLPSKSTNVFRLIYDFADGLSGLVVDVFDNVCVCEIYSYGFYNLMDELERILKKFLGNVKVIFTASSYTMTMEKFKLNENPKMRVKVFENDIAFEVYPGLGYKTGFFCDQRENRLYLTNFVRDKDVLDLFSYTGGFGIYAKKFGARNVVCVELDNDAVRMGKRNANINNLRIEFICADAFTYVRQMIVNKKMYDVVIVDPNKFINSKEKKDEGVKKYVDINALSLNLVKKGGILVSCSCSGLLSMDEFVDVIRKASSISKRMVRIFKKTYAGVDHPFMVNWPEGEYLKVVWCSVE